MRRRVINSMGLGQTQVDLTVPTSVGGMAVPGAGPDFQTLAATCSSWLYWVSPSCWSGPYLSPAGESGFLSYNAWQQLAALPQPSTSVLAAPAAPASSTPAVSDISTLVDQAATQTEQNIADFAQTIPDNPVPDEPCTWFNIPCWLLWVGGGLLALAVLVPDTMGSHTGGRSIL